MVEEVKHLVLQRAKSDCNFIEWKQYRIVYKRLVFHFSLLQVSHLVRYASLYFMVCTDITDNELIALEVIQLFVEVRILIQVFLHLTSLCLAQSLDQYFGSVCELDLIFNFHSVSHMRVLFDVVM